MWEPKDFKLDINNVLELLKMQIVGNEGIKFA